MNDFDLKKFMAQASSWEMIRALGGIGILCSLLIVFAFQVTLPIIEKNKTEYLEKSIFNVLPGATSRVTYKITDDNNIEPIQVDEPKARKVYAGYNDQGELVGIAIEASGQGFQDVIRILYGYSPDKKAVIGFTVLESKETPGLGDKIQSDPTFLSNFEALDVTLTDDGSAIKNPIEMAKSGNKHNPWQIEAITGATISSRAVTKILNQSTEEYIPIIEKNLQIFKRDETS
jgi:electron transport complex protein RnfG